MRIFWLLLWVTGCGLTDPKYVEYEGGDSTTETAECEEGTASFAENITFVASCAIQGCHLTGGGDLTLNNDPTADRTALLAMLSKYTDASGLYDKIAGQNGQSHTGVSAASSVDLAKLQAWEEVEKNCPTTE